MAFLLVLIVLFTVLYMYPSFAYVGTNMGPCKVCHTFSGEHLHYTSANTSIKSDNYAKDNTMCSICESYPGEKHFHTL